MVIHTVVRGESLYSIARRYGTSPEILARDNGLEGRTALTVGQTLVILQPISTYTVQEGDNLYSIAMAFGVSVGDLLRNNAFLGGRDEIRPGQVLTVVPEPTRFDREISVNAYVYPSVDRDILRSTLPYLTYLTIFTYRARADGSLVPIDDEEVIALARQYGVAPLMLVSTIGESGGFSSRLAGELLGNEEAKQNLIEQIADTLAQKGYRGVDVDFEYVSAEYVESYVSFVEALRERLTPLGLIVVVSLSPKTRDDQPGLLYEAHDYGALGAAADRSFLMTYEWGYTYGPPMAVSPVDKVRGVLDYAISRIPPEKIFLGVPNYGYNWPLPYVEGQTRARSVGNAEAVDLAREKRAAISFDEEAASPYFRYYDRTLGGAEAHEVWFEDARSVDALIRLVDEYGLDGMGVWNAMRYFVQLWIVLNATYPIRKLWN